MGKRTFLIVTSTYYPGVDASTLSDHINAVATALARKGHEVHITHTLDASAPGLRCCSSAWGNLVAEWEAEHPGLVVHTLRPPLGIVESLFAYLLGSSPCMNKQLRNIIREAQPDVVHYHSPMFLGHRILRKQGDYLSVYTAHDYWLICERGYLLKDNQRPCVVRKNCFFCAVRSMKPPQLGRHTVGFRKAISDIDLILAPSMAVQERLSEELDTRIECIPHFAPYFRQTLASSGYSDYFLFAGALEVHKGILNLLAAFARYSNRINGKLIITGRGKLERRIIEFIAKQNLQSKVVYLGWVDKEMLWSLYRDALALVVPSINIDPAPAVIVEALSVGTPVIGSDKGGIAERVGKLDKNLIFRSDDVADLGKILMNYKKEDYRPQMVKEVCRRWFSTESYISRYLDVLESAGATRK